MEGPSVPKWEEEVDDARSTEQRETKGNEIKSSLEFEKFYRGN